MTTTANIGNISTRASVNRSLSLSELDTNFDELKNVISDVVVIESTLTDIISNTSITDSQLPSVMNNKTLRGQTTMDSILLENGSHRITTNDGGGNFNIRVGHRFDTVLADRVFSSNIEGAVHLTVDHDLSTANPGFLIYAAPSPVTTGNVAGDLVSNVRNIFTVYYDGTITTNGNTIFHSGNDGINSGLDADYLRGVTLGTSGNAIAQLSAANTWSQKQTFQSEVQAQFVRYGADGPSTYKFRVSPSTSIGDGDGYFDSGEGIDLLTIAPKGIYRNYMVSGTLCELTSPTYEKIDFVLSVRSQATTADTTATLRYSAESSHNTATTLVPVIWRDTVTGVIKLMIKCTGSNKQAVSIDLTVFDRDGYNDHTITGQHVVYTLPENTVELAGIVTTFTDSTNKISFMGDVYSPTSVYANNLFANTVNLSSTVIQRDSDTVFYSSVNDTLYKNTKTGLLKSLGLDQIDNTSDLNKPLSTAAISALNEKLNANLVGASNGVVPLDVDQKIPAIYLPSFVEEIIEVSSVSALPVTGVSGKIYLATDTSKIYRWGGTAYAEINASPGSSDDVTEGVINKYYTTQRVYNDSPVKSVNGKTGNVSLSFNDFTGSISGNLITGNINVSQLSIDNTAYLTNFNGGNIGTLIGSNIGASSFGTVIKGANNGQVVVYLDTNDDSDGFNVISSGNTTSNDPNKTPDTIALRVTRKGVVTANKFVGDGSSLTNIQASNIVGSIQSPNLEGTAPYLTAGNVTNGVYTVGDQTIVGIKTFSGKELRIGGSNTENYINFRGTFQDDQIPFTHTYIGERIYQGPENSELLLFKGDNVTDRIRSLSGEFIVETFGASGASGSFANVANTVPRSQFKISNNGAAFFSNTVTATEFIGNIVPKISGATTARNTDTIFYSSTNDTLYKNTKEGMLKSLGVDTTLNQFSTAISNQSQEIDQLELNKANFTLGNFVANPVDLATTQNASPDQSVIFNSWTRFSHDTTANQPALPAELTAWSYNSATEEINNTTNSSSFIGVVSTGKYENYVLDVKLNSSNADDDLIGVVIAWDVDPVTGREYTLSLVRTPGGMGPLHAIVYNFNRSDAWVIQNGSPTVTWANGASGSLSKAAAAYNNNPGWSGLITTYGGTGGTRVKITRDSDVITALTSQWATSDTLDPSTTLVVDLNSDPRLARFKGAKGYGFCSFSQASSSWKVLQFTNPTDSIYDLSTGNVYVFNGSSWVVDSATTLQNILPNSILFNPSTKQLFYFENSTSISAIGKFDPTNTLSTRNSDTAFYSGDGSVIYKNTKQGMLNSLGLGSVGTNANGTKYVSTSDPVNTTGVDGDIWYKI